MKYIKKYENKIKILYPYNDIEYFINWFNNKYYSYTESQGWAIFDSDTSLPQEKYISDSGKYQKFWQIQHYEDMKILNSDSEADILARKLGLMIDEYGVIIGYNGDFFLNNTEILNFYKEINKYNL